MGRALQLVYRSHILLAETYSGSCRRRYMATTSACAVRSLVDVTLLFPVRRSDRFNDHTSKGAPGWLVSLSVKCDGFRHEFFFAGHNTNCTDSKYTD